ncbi:hypothetical protein BX265_8304 [Streptomyces sp. TLI_235]|nr:hypothetical protein BX265_8304 [Streptomyces sp. TLI_235]
MGSSGGPSPVAGVLGLQQYTRQAGPTPTPRRARRAARAGPASAWHGGPSCCSATRRGRYGRSRRSPPCRGRLPRPPAAPCAAGSPDVALPLGERGENGQAMPEPVGAGGLRSRLRGVLGGDESASGSMPIAASRSCWPLSKPSRRRRSSCRYPPDGRSGRRREDGVDGPASRGRPEWRGLLHCTGVLPPASYDRARALGPWSVPGSCTFPAAAFMGSRRVRRGAGRAGRRCGRPSRRAGAAAHSPSPRCVPGRGLPARTGRRCAVGGRPLQLGQARRGLAEEVGAGEPPAGGIAASVGRRCATTIPGVTPCRHRSGRRSAPRAVCGMIASSGITPSRPAS